LNNHSAWQVINGPTDVLQTFIDVQSHKVITPILAQVRGDPSREGRLGVSWLW
jgi:hypothetical protein